VSRPRKKCRNCGHHIAAHQYDPADLGRKPPKKCQVPGCRCVEFVRPQPFERVGSMMS
jgi:hypothetical protein